MSIVGKKCFCLRELFFWGSTFLILRLNFPNFPDELSEFSGLTFRILLNFPNFSSQNRWGPFFFGLTPSPFLISGQLSEFFDYFPNSRLLSEFWFTFRILAENGPGTGFLGSHFFPTMVMMTSGVWEATHNATSLQKLGRCIYMLRVAWFETVTNDFWTNAK